MKQATEHKWTLVLSGVDRSDASRAFRNTGWQSSWYDNASALDTDEDSGLIVSIDVSDLTQLIALLAAVGKLRCTYGIQLCVGAKFGAVSFDSNLCTAGEYYQAASATMNQTVEALVSEADCKIGQIETLLHDVRILISANGE